MLQNKIYQNFFLRILKTFFSILLGFTLIALTVRSVNFLELIVDSGYPVTTYFKYSVLNIFGIIPKFIPFSFLITLIIFINKNNDENELLILWTSGVKKITIANFMLGVSLLLVLFTLVFSVILTPYALNKSRDYLKKENFNSFLPTVRAQQFNDSFKGFTFFVESKVNNEVKKIFLHDSGSNLKNLQRYDNSAQETIVLAENGIIKNKNLFLLNGQIISKKNYDNNKKYNENEIIKFDQLKINLENLATTTIKSQKIQETSTLKLLSCFKKNLTNQIFQTLVDNEKYCNNDYKKEIISSLNRRVVIPFYIPLLALICGLLLIKSEKMYFKKNMIYAYGFMIILFTELSVRYTGFNIFISLAFILTPIILFATLYFFIMFKFSNELNR